MTAGERALLQSVRERREKGLGEESEVRAADRPPLLGSEPRAAGGASPGPSQDGLDAGVLAAGTGF